MMDISILLITAVVILAAYLYFAQSSDVFAKQGIPGHLMFPLIGNTFHLMKFGFMEYHDWCKRKYGNIVRQKGFGGNGLIIYDINLLKDIMIKESSSFIDRNRPLELPRPFDRSIGNLTGDDWRRVRHAISPTFTSGKLKKMCSILNRSVEVLADRFRTFAINKQDIDVREIFGRYNMSVIAETMFGMQVDAMTNDDDSFTKHAKKLLNFSPLTIIMLILKKVPGLGLLFRDVQPIDLGVIKFFTEAVEHAIEERKGNEDQYHDFLALMLKAEVSEDVLNDSSSAVRGLTNEEIMGQSILFMFAGYETSSAGLTYASYLLALHPEVQERLRDEISSEFCDDTPETIYESLSRMPYLDKCLKECLRLYCPAVISDRVAVEDTMIGNIKIPKASCITIPIQTILRDPEHWHDPETFNPDRFDEHEGESGKVPFYYLVFGNGPRNCIGKRFAIMNLKLALINVLRNVRLIVCERTPEEPLEFGFLGLPNPKKPMIIRAEIISE